MYTTFTFHCIHKYLFALHACMVYVNSGIRMHSYLVHEVACMCGRIVNIIIERCHIRSLNYLVDQMVLVFLVIFITYDDSSTCTFISVSSSTILIKYISGLNSYVLLAIRIIEKIQQRMYVRGARGPYLSEQLLEQGAHARLYI